MSHENNIAMEIVFRKLSRKKNYLEIFVKCNIKAIEIFSPFEYSDMLLCLLVLQNTLSRRGQVASLSTEYLGASGRSFLSTWEPTFPWRSLSLSISDLTVALKVILTLMVHLNEQNSLDIGIKYSREALMFVPYIQYKVSIRLR